MVNDLGATMKAALPASPHSGRTSDQSLARLSKSFRVLLAMIGNLSICVCYVAKAQPLINSCTFERWAAGTLWTSKNSIVSVVVLWSAPRK